MKKRLILASGSPRRKELLAELGFDFEVITSNAEEEHRNDISLTELCERNAEIKTRAVANKYPDAVVLGGDTLVYIDDEPLGKPNNKEEAVAMLERLSGRTHQVCSGMCLIEGEHVKSFHAVTQVVFKDIDRSVIDAYVQRVDVMDKAGSYAVQECGKMIIERVDGDFSNVVGLPQQMVGEQLAAFGLQPEGKLSE
ncbi:Maf family protein [Rubritalea spongiae]|uniref:dTTP/UTP pyrophosphatase n=1 Tax=Rubritalea spongiae TaxID=430797 RepID=A0ABW5E4D0_9BACT